MRYFVTGATSFIGRAVTRRLVEAGHEVITVNRKPDKARQSLDRDIEVLYGDIIFKDSMRDAFKGLDGVFHMASYAHFRTREKAQTASLNVDVKVKRSITQTMKDFSDARAKARAEAKSGMSTAERINVVGTRNVLELMKEYKVPKGVYTGTMAIYSDTKSKMLQENARYKGPWNSEYERTMWKAHFEVAEPMMREGRLPLVIVQPGLLYGPGDSGFVHEFLQAYLNREKTTRSYLQRQMRTVPRKTTFCWSHIDDVADAHIAAMQKGKIGENYFLTGPAHSLVNVLEQAQKLTGIAMPKRQLPPLALRLASAWMHIAGHFSAVPEYYSWEALKSVAGTTSLGSHDKASRELGFSPRTLHEGLRYTLYHEMRVRGMIELEHSEDDMQVLDLEPEHF